MKRTLKLVIVGAAALMLLGTQVSFAADQARARDRLRTQDPTCGSATQTKKNYRQGSMNQIRNQIQNKNVSGTATQSRTGR